MFWKRKTKIVNSCLGPIAIPPVPARPIFIEMFELLRDAEKFDNQGYKNSCKIVLDRLSEVSKSYENEN